MINNKFIVRAGKIVISFLIYLFFILMLSSTIFSELPIRSLSQNLGIQPNIVMNIGFACSLVLASILLSVVMIKLKLKVIDGVLIAALLALYNSLIISDDLTIHQCIEIALLLFIPSIVVFCIFKYKKPNSSLVK